jgi:integrase
MGRSASTEGARAQALAFNLTPKDTADTLDGLVDVWQKVNPRSKPRKYIASLERLKKFVGGNIAWRSLTRPQCSAWRDALVKEYRLGSPSPTKHLDNIKGLFRAARIEGLVAKEDIPVAGIVDYNYKPNEEEEGRPFTGEQIKTILAKAAEAQIFDEFRVEVLWILKLMTWTGLRPNEAAQLRTSDIYEIDGVRVIHVRATLGTDQQMQLKKGARRKIPLQTAIADFWDYVRARNTDFVFDALLFNKDNGRADWLMRRFGTFLREVCKIKTPEGERKLTLYSLRHSYHDAMDNCEPPIPDDMQRVLGAHAKKDAHERYGRGADLAKLAKAAKRINPLKLRTG